MSFNTLVDVEQVVEHLEDQNWLIVDCRFNLQDTEAGRRAYRESHIPGAVYAHLDEDLSGPPVTDRGRHPLPAPEALNTLFSRLGVAAKKQVVAYDEAGGGIAARLWWLLRYMGHDDVAVLNGGWRAWVKNNYPVESGIREPRYSQFAGEPQREWLVLAKDVASVPLLVDSRAPARYQGIHEPLDPVAGHIPGAINYYYGNNLDTEQRFLPPEQLRLQFEAVTADTAPDQVVFYCGSGVSACHNILAQVHARLAPGRLYAGSWSDWISDPTRPVQPKPSNSKSD